MSHPKQAAFIQLQPNVSCHLRLPIFQEKLEMYIFTRFLKQSKPIKKKNMAYMLVTFLDSSDPSERISYADQEQHMAARYLKK